MVDISSWVGGSLVLELHEELLLDWGKVLEIKSSRLSSSHVHKACCTKALVTCITHSLHVSDITSSEITLSVVCVILLIVVGLLSALAVIVLVIDVLDIVVL